MAPIATLTVRLSAQIAEFQSEFREAAKSAQKFASEFEGIATRASAVGEFIGRVAHDIATSIGRALSQALRDAVRLSSEFSNALIGLSSVARAFGTDANVAKEAARKLSSDGLLPLKDSATGLKNLLAAGFNLEQSTKLMNAFKDSAAFGRQSALSFGDAVRSATEGVKNGNSILVDNAGVTKNLSQILKEAGFSAQDLSRASSDAAVRMALFNGILKETRAQTGDAERLTQTYTGQISRLSTAYDNLLATAGAAVTENKTVATAIGAVSDAFVRLNGQLVNSRTAFTLISDAVIFFVKSMSFVLNAIDLIQTGFAGLQQVSNRLFEAFSNIGIAAFKVIEKVAQLSKVLDPLHWQEHAASVELARRGYTYLEGASQGLRDASADAEKRSIAWGNTLQGLRANLIHLGKTLEETRGKTVELGATDPLKPIADGAGKAEGSLAEFLKSLKRLTADIDLANKHATPLAKLVELFGNEANKSAEKAKAWGVTVKASVTEVANAFRTTKLKDFLIDFFERQTNESRKHWDKFQKELEQSIDRLNKVFLKNLDVGQSALTALFKVNEKLEADSLERRLSAVSRDAEGRRLQLDKHASNYAEMLGIVDELERRSAELATFEWQQHISETQKALNTFPNIFRTALQEIPKLIQQALTGGGGLAGGIKSILSSLGSAVGGKVFGDLAAKLSNTFVETFGVKITSALGNIIPGLGAALGALIGPLIDKAFSAFDRNKGRDLVKDFAKSFGGFDQLQKRLLELGEAGGQLWIKLTQGVGRNNPEQAKAVIAEVTAALDAFGTEAERAERRLAGITLAIGGVNIKAELFAKPFQDLIDARKKLIDEFGKDADPLKLQNIDNKLAETAQRSQAEFERIGTFAAAAFAGIVRESGDAIGALKSLTPTLTVLRDGVEKFGLTSSGTIDALLGIFSLVNDAVTGPIFEGIQATGQIFTGLQQGGLLTKDLFQTVATDIGASFRELEAKGGDVSKAMALSQPVLQKLWEGQQLYGEITDETTRKLLEQAEEQGLVGDHMKDVNQKILDVLIAIADVFGAQLPESFRKTTGAAKDTARDIQSEFDKLKPTVEVKIEYNDPGHVIKTGVVGEETGEPRLVAMAKGGIVRQPTLALIGEAGPEAVIPLSHGATPVAGSSTVILEVDGRNIAEVVAPHFPGVVRKYVLA